MGYCKIGFAINPIRRMTALQHAIPPSITVSLFKKFKVPKGKSPRAIEKFCHFELKQYWSGKGEWFEVDLRIATNVIKKAIKNKIVKPEWFPSKAWVSRTQKQLWKNPKHRKKLILAQKKGRAAMFAKLSSKERKEFFKKRGHAISKGKQIASIKRLLLKKEKQA